MVPADECLRADDLTGSGVGLRLEVELDFAVADCPLQVGGKRETVT